MWVERGKTELIIALIALTLMGCSHAHVHKKAAGTFTVHVYPEGPCHLCHIGKGTYIGSENLRAPGKKLCFMCHSFRKEKYVHRAIELWDCAICHNPHGTDNPFLLKSPLPALCFGCHVERDIRSMEVHKDLRLGCTDCHTPHMADNKLLLKKEFSGRITPLLKSPSSHRPFEGQKK